MPYITDKFGHRLWVPEWPSDEGMAILRRHYKKHHPKAFREMIAKGVATRAARENQPFRHPDEDETGPTDYPPAGRSVWCKRCHGIAEEGELSPEGYCVECVLILEEVRGNPGHVHYDRSLGARMHEWHDGMSDPIYQVGSLIAAGQPVPVGDAIEAYHAFMPLQASAEKDGQTALVRDIQGIMDDLGAHIVEETGQPEVLE